MQFWDKSVLFFATGCGVGNIPFAPGTLGSALGLFFCFLLSKFHVTISISIVVISIGFAVWIADRASKILQENDPGCIVIDEMAGMAVVLIGLPFKPMVIFLGFILFRFLDILKPFPIRYIEKKWHGGIGIVMDDIAAGLIGHAVLRIALVLTGR